MRRETLIHIGSDFGRDEKSSTVGSLVGVKCLNPSHCSVTSEKLLRPGNFVTHIGENGIAIYFQFSCHNWRCHMNSPRHRGSQGERIYSAGQGRITLTQKSPLFAFKRVWYHCIIPAVEPISCFPCLLAEGTMNLFNHASQCMRVCRRVCMFEPKSVSRTLPTFSRMKFRLGGSVLYLT